jgi:hypothetical protein
VKEALQDQLREVQKRNELPNTRKIRTKKWTRLTFATILSGVGNVEGVVEDFESPDPEDLLRRPKLNPPERKTQNLSPFLQRFSRPKELSRKPNTCNISSKSSLHGAIHCAFVLPTIDLANPP